MQGCMTKMPDDNDNRVMPAASAGSGGGISPPVGPLMQNSGATSLGDGPSSKEVENFILYSIQPLKKEIDNLKKGIDSQQQMVDTFEKRMQGVQNRAEERVRLAERRSIEIVGLFSSVIALLLTFVGSAREAAQTRMDPRDTFCILITTVSSLVVFASIIHLYFGHPKKYSRNEKIYLFVLPVLGIIFSGILMTGINNSLFSILNNIKGFKIETVCANTANDQLNSTSNKLNGTAGAKTIGSKG